MDTSAQDYKFIDDNVILCSLDLCLNKDRLKALEIRKVLTVSKTPVKTSDKESRIYYKCVPLSDQSSHCDILIYLDQCVNYIMESQKYGENIVVHGINNESVSTAIATAFLMKKRRIEMREAVETVMMIPKICQQISPTFIESLEIWKRNEYRLNTNLGIVRLPIFETFIKDVTNKILNNTAFDYHLLNNYISLVSDYEENMKRLEDRGPNCELVGHVYACAICTQFLFFDKNVIKSYAHSECQYIYIHPSYWIVKQALDKVFQKKDERYLFRGWIYCWYCRNPVGNYNWDTKNACLDCLLHKDSQTFLIYRFPINMIRIFNSTEDYKTFSAANNSENNSSNSTNSNSDPHIPSAN